MNSNMKKQLFWRKWGVKQSEFFQWQPMQNAGKFSYSEN